MLKEAGAKRVIGESFLSVTINIVQIWFTIIPSRYHVEKHLEVFEFDSKASSHTESFLAQLFRY